jgi:Putative lumazine-binding
MDSYQMTTPRSLVSEYDAIVDVLNTYISGAKTGNSEHMKPAFAGDATIYGYVGEELAFSGPIQTLFDWNQENGPAEGILARIAHLDIIGQVAHARVEAENWTGLRFTDLLLLVKRNGKWAIQNKVFHLHSA